MSSETARLRWRCRRGMRELDKLLAAYLEQRYVHADAIEQETFRQFLDLPDPVIFSWVLGREQPPRGPMRDLVKRILTTSQA